ncbi:MAG: hypothetical protein ACMXYL_05065 [Candidatus Woesearchaeota archaeon]
MNWFAHFFIGYMVTAIFVSNPSEHIVIIAFFSVFLDVDHLPGMYKLLTKRIDRKSMSLAEESLLFRTPLQEPIGLITIQIIIVLLHYAGFNTIILLLATIGIWTHWIIDLLTVYTRPLYPYNKRQYSLFFHNRKEKYYGEMIITTLSFILFMAVYLM